ncbi:hypothetical protein FGO68_gene13037 [Halteria grandinella]|uniref:Uncharacterized protein n=1 Tax=Halteria grandinella TaxID=5974 RepID=A0A8J8T9Z9_HALGN|nr:hypothetical protein FGO68_gene13037 [Halteria grandinella]
MEQQTIAGRPKSAYQQMQQTQQQYLPQPDQQINQYGQYPSAMQGQYLGQQDLQNNINYPMYKNQSPFGRYQSPSSQFPQEQYGFYSPPPAISQHIHSPLIINQPQGTLFAQTIPIQFEPSRPLPQNRQAVAAERPSRLEALPSFRNLKKQKPTQRAQSQGHNKTVSSQENFGTQSLKSILNNIEMVEETDKYKKEKTKRRYQPPPRKKHIVMNDKTTDKKPPAHMNFGNIRTLNVESLEDEDLEDTIDDNALTVVNHRSPQHIEPAQQKQQRDFQIKLHSLQSSRKRVRDAMTNRGRSAQIKQEDTLDTSKTVHESRGFVRKLGDFVSANFKARFIREIVKISSIMRISFVENQRRHFSRIT